MPMKHGEARRWKSDGPEEAVVLSQEGRPVPVRLQAELVGSERRDRVEFDRWSLVLSFGEETFVLDSYCTGEGLRRRHGLLPEPVPVQPRLSEVLESLSSDLSTAAEMPRSTREALDWAKSELGAESPGKALDIVEGLRRLHDGLSPVLARAGLDASDLWAWLRSSSNPPEKADNHLRVVLPPAVHPDGSEMRGVLDISLRAAKGGGRTTDLEPVPEGATVLSVRNAKAWERASGSARDEEVGVPNPRDWEGVPRAAELLRLVARYERGDLHAGTEAQQAFLDERPELRDFNEKKAALAEAGLEPDRGYSYGSAWLVRTVPPEDAHLLRLLAREVNEMSRRDAPPTPTP